MRQFQNKIGELLELKALYLGGAKRIERKLFVKQLPVELTVQRPEMLVKMSVQRPERPVLRTKGLRLPPI
jgi:hypothetical protein